MDSRVKGALMAERKWKRELTELRALRLKLQHLKAMDQTMVAAVDAEIARYLADDSPLTEN